MRIDRQQTFRSPIVLLKWYLCLQQSFKRDLNIISTCISDLLRNQNLHSKVNNFHQILPSPDHLNYSIQNHFKALYTYRMSTIVSFVSVSSPLETKLKSKYTTKNWSLLSNLGAKMCPPHIVIHTNTRKYSSRVEWWLISSDVCEDCPYTPKPLQPSFVKTPCNKTTDSQKHALWNSCTGVHVYCPKDHQSSHLLMLIRSQKDHPHVFHCSWWQWVSSCTSIPPFLPEQCS